MWVVLGTHPAVEGTLVCGPFRSLVAAAAAWYKVSAAGYVAETVELVSADGLEKVE